jgi:fumarylpyruvate hydrolase
VPTFLFDPSIASLAVAGTDARFPVRRIFCIGRNYAAHAREMGGAVDAEAPILFCKPADTVVPDGATIPYPSLTHDLHHEVELVAAIGTGGRDIDPARALDHVFGYAAGLDLTRRDLQSELRRNGKPWDWAKGFDDSAPVGTLRTVADIGGHPTRGRITLHVDGALRQDGDLADMVTSTADMIALISRGVALRPGDLVFTGTPSGVGPLARGQTARGEIEGVGTVTLTIAP